MARSKNFMINQEKSEESQDKFSVFILQLDSVGSGLFGCCFFRSPLSDADCAPGNYQVLNSFKDMGQNCQRTSGGSTYTSRTNVTCLKSQLSATLQAAWCEIVDIKHVCYLCFEIWEAPTWSGAAKYSHRRRNTGGARGQIRFSPVKHLIREKKRDNNKQ